MWQILHATFWKFTKLSNSGISLHWSITDKVTTRNTTAYFFGPLCITLADPISNHNPDTIRKYNNKLISAASFFTFK